MKYGRLNRLFPITMAILAVALIGLSGCTESAGSSFVVPTFTEPGPPPIEVTVDQLYQEYMADEAAADAKYKGVRLLFTEVEVEEVNGTFYFMTGSVGFKLRDFGIMQNIREGYVLNIVGECRGLVSGWWTGGEPFPLVDDCWVESVIGDIGSGGEIIDPY